MKLHEIDWTDGKKYKVTFAGKTLEVAVIDLDLYIARDKLLRSEYNLKALIRADYTPIINPVTFEEAYEDCKENKTKYIRTDKMCVMRNFGGSVIVERVGNDCAIALNGMNWTKEEQHVTR